VLFGQHGAHEADQGVAVREDPDDVGAAADLLVEAFLGVVRPDLAPDLFRERGERRQVRTCVLKMVGDLGELVGEGSTSGAVVVSRSANTVGQSISWAVVIASIPLLE
jgi:hypothetical protein